MKKLEELGISPAPWKANGCEVMCFTDDGTKYILEAQTNSEATFIAAAPELYEALRDATYEYCHACENGRGNCPKKDGDCFVQKWRAALAKASGESEVAK